MTALQRFLSLGGVALIALGCGPKRYEAAPPPAPAHDAIAVTADSTAPRYQFQVTKPALVIESGIYARYPRSLESSRTEGSVLVQFVVGTDGRAEMATFKVLRSTNDAFTAAVRAIVPLLRFTPAEANGKKVRQYVQLPYEFRVQN